MVEVVRALAKEACQRLAGYARVFNFARSHNLACQGWRHWLEGRHYKARKFWQEAITKAQTYQMPYEEGLANYHLGRFAPVHSPEQAQYLERAYTIFTKLGIGYYCQQISQLANKEKVEIKSA